MKTTIKQIFLITCIIPILSSSQNYNTPESVEYNPMSGNYFISNSGNGQILETDIDGNLSVFVNELNTGPHGLELIYDFDWILFASSGSKLYAYNMNGDEVLNYNLNGSFLNGITNKHDPITGEFDLFITDFSDKKLYRYNIQDSTHYEVCSFSKNPNGTYYDSINNRLLVVCWGWNAPIYEIDLINETYSTIINTGLSNLDGITMDQCGNFYVSAWGSNSIHKYNSDFSETEIIIDGLNNPADIYYNVFDNILGIPNSGNNTVDFIDLACDNSFLEEIHDKKKIIRNIDLLGRETNKSGFNIRFYNNGIIEKIYVQKY